MPANSQSGPEAAVRVVADAAADERPWLLIVDDSRVIRRAIGKALSAEFNLIEAEDGEAGWERLAADERIQVVVSDVEMPRLDGYALICRIRADENQRVREVPVIIITGADDAQTRERAFACGATDFITKPIDSVQLLARARAHARLDQTTRDLNEATKTLEDQTAIDPLTELHSRRYFLQRAQQDLAYARRHAQPLAFIRIDVDDFRGVYRQLGDEITDRLIVWIARTLRATTRTEDTTARIRASEFAVLAPATGRDDGAALCERLRTAVAEHPFEHEGKTFALTISLGLSVYGTEIGDTPEALIARAEERLTLAKAAGGNQLGIGYETAVPAPEETVIEEPDLETALRMLASDESGLLAPFLPSLLARLLPLLQYADQRLELDLATVLESLRERIDPVK